MLEKKGNAQKNLIRRALKDVYLDNFIIYHHFVQCPPKIARNDHYLWLTDSFFSNNQYFWPLEFSKF